MAFWGMALAVGPNYNLPVDHEREQIAFENIQKARALAGKAPENERAYIEALARRYSNNPDPDYTQLAVAYKNAMQEVSRRFPDDLDAATLYAESLMNLHPWGLWKKDGTPVEGTETILAVLESVLRRDPNHMGAIHYYIHSLEASRNPERALAAANQLASLSPAAGHLVHMPAHIYIRTGNYDVATSTNVAAAKADESYAKLTGATGIYPLMYYSHNLHFIAAAAGMEGRYTTAREAAARLAAHVGPILEKAPMLEAFLIVPLAVELRFEKWDEVLKHPAPEPKWTKRTAMWHYARGMALAATGRSAEARKEQQALEESEAATAEDAVFTMPINNRTRDILRIASSVLAAKHAAADGDRGTAIRALETAVKIQDDLNYGEPPDWYFPVREALGAVLLANGENEKAEQVFRADLEHNPRNGRSLFGLCEALKAQGKNYDAQFVRRQFEAAWRNADVPLTLQSLW